MINQQVVLSVWALCLDEDNKTPEQDALSGIIATKEMKEVSLGSYFDPTWADNQEMPAIRLYVSLLYHFENLTETFNFNLVASVLEVMESTSTANVYEIVDNFDKAVDPIALIFT